MLQLLHVIDFQKILGILYTIYKKERIVNKKTNGTFIKVNCCNYEAKSKSS
jgi:hypothetical protein